MIDYMLVIFVNDILVFFVKEHFQILLFALSRKHLVDSCISLLCIMLDSRRIDSDLLKGRGLPLLKDKARPWNVIDRSGQCCAIGTMM